MTSNQFTKHPAANVPLPSKGRLYSVHNSFFNKEYVTVNAMTCEDEDLLFNQSYKQNNTTIEKLITSCLIEKDINVSELLVGDKVAIMMAIKISGYGSRYEPIINCPSCETQNHFEINLSSLPIKSLDIEPLLPGENLFKFVLPKTKKTVKFKFFTIAMERRLRLNAEKQENAITSHLLESIVEIDGISDRDQIEDFVQKMYAYDSRYLREYISAHEPGVSLETYFDCSNCSFSEKLDLPNDYEFFSINPEDREMIWLEPMFLLMYYCGITPFEYLHLPLYIRKWLIERTNKEIEAAAKADSQPVSRGAHHNTPEIRALSNKTRHTVPGKLRRFT